MRSVKRVASVGAIALAITMVSPLTSAIRADAKEVDGCSSYGFECDHQGYAERAYQSYWTMAPGHNCTNYVAYRLIKDGMPRGIEWLHNGGQWSWEARAHGYKVDQLPAPGDVANWEGGMPNISYAGHVAYVEKVTKNSITITEDNYSSGPLRVRTIYRGDQSWPSYFIHLKKAPPRAPKPKVSKPAKVKIRDVTGKWLPSLSALQIYG